MAKHTQTIRLPTNYLSVFDHFVGLVLKVLRQMDFPITGNSAMSRMLLKIYETKETAKKYLCYNQHSKRRARSIFLQIPYIHLLIYNYTEKKTNKNKQKPANKANENKIRYRTKLNFNLAYQKAKKSVNVTKNLMFELYNMK